MKKPNYQKIEAQKKHPNAYERWTESDDRFLKNSDVPSIALTYAKQIVKKVPTSANDVKIDWIVTENETIDTSSES